MENLNVEKEQDLNQEVEKKGPPAFDKEIKSYFQNALGVIKGKENPESLENDSYMLPALIIMAFYPFIPSLLKAFTSARSMWGDFEFVTFVTSFFTNILLYGLGLGVFFVAIFLAYKYTDNAKSWKEVLPQVAIVIPVVLVLLLLSFVLNFVSFLSSPLSSIARVLPFFYFYYVLSDKKVDARKLFIVSLAVFAGCAVAFSLIGQNPFILSVYSIRDIMKSLF